MDREKLEKNVIRFGIFLSQDAPFANAQSNGITKIDIDSAERIVKGVSLDFEGILFFQEGDFIVSNREAVRKALLQVVPFIWHNYRLIASLITVLIAFANVQAIVWRYKNNL